MITEELQAFAAGLVMDGKLTAAEAESDLISRRTIGRSIAKIREHGHIPQKKKSTGRPTKLTDVAKSFMLAYIRRHPSTFQEELQELLKAFYNIETHQSNISRFLAREGYTFKKMSRRAAQRDEARRLRYTIDVASYEQTQLVFADESYTDNRSNLRTRV